MLEIDSEVVLCVTKVEGLVRLMEGEHVGPFNLGNPGEFTMVELAQVNVAGNTLPTPSCINFSRRESSDFDIPISCCSFCISSVEESLIFEGPNSFRTATHSERRRSSRFCFGPKSNFLIDLLLGNCFPTHTSPNMASCHPAD